MSGPKKTKAELEREALERKRKLEEARRKEELRKKEEERKRLEEARRREEERKRREEEERRRREEERRRREEEERKRREEEARKKRVQKAVMDLKTVGQKTEKRILLLKSEVERFESFLERGGINDSDIGPVKEKIQTAEKMIQDISKVTVQEDEESLLNRLQEADKQIEILTDTLKQFSLESQDRQEKFHRDNENKIETGLKLDLFNEDMKQGQDKVEDTDIIQKRTLVKEKLKELEKLHLSNSQAAKLKELRARSEEINDSSYLSNFYDLEFIPFKEDCFRHEAFYKDNIDEYWILSDTCQLLAEELGYEVEPIELSEAGMSALKRIVQELDEKKMQAIQQEYFSETIDDILKEMGYSVIGSRSGEDYAGKHFKNELYQLEAGTAVSVTFDDNMQVAMELCGLDNVDRDPSVQEAQSLVQDMDRFCDDFDRIRKMAKERGLKLSLVAHLPSEEDTAQILNINDYDMNCDVEFYSAHEKKRKSDTTQKKQYLD